MTRSLILTLSVILLSPLGWSSAGLRADDGVRPNIIFILADDLGWGDLGCYGQANAKTPHLDGLAEEGTLFTQFYVNGSVCSPSRTAFMTGQYPARHRVHGHFAQRAQNESRGMPNWLDPSVATLTRLLQASGYRTAHFGKWHLSGGGIPEAPAPGEYGIDDFRAVNASGSGSQTYDQRQPFFRANSTRLFVDETLRFIKENREQPFYVNLWTLLTHATLHPTDRQMEPYRRFGPSNVPYKGALQIYYASISDLDEQIGRLVQSLDELGLADNTLILFTSDNGPEDIHIRNASHSGVGSAGPFRGRKRSLYEGGVRMPFIARWPNRIPAGRVNDTSVITAVDFLPTLCHLAGVDLPNGFAADGEDVSDILTGTIRERTRPIMWEWRFNIAGHVLHKSPILSIREGKWKLLMNPDRSRVELYDIPHDPSELGNLATRRPEVTQRLSRRLLAWQKTLPPGPLGQGAGDNRYTWPRQRE